jgi:hypothetical protein
MRDAPGQEAKPPDDRPWDERIFERIDPGIDGTLVEENLRRSPTQRRWSADRSPDAPPTAGAPGLRTGDARGEAAAVQLGDELTGVDRGFQRLRAGGDFAAR